MWEIPKAYVCMYVLNVNSEFQGLQKLCFKVGYTVVTAQYFDAFNFC